MTVEAARSPEGAAGWQEAALRSYLGRLTGGISPASVMQAYTDWLLHLAASPAKQASLMHKAIRKASRLAVLQRDAWLGNSATCIEPLPQDRRFNAPEWRTLPYSVWYQAFLLSQQWWWNATTGVRGVTQHHEDVVTFITRQLLDIFSPSNFVVTNPEVWDKTMRTGGLNLVQGAQNWWNDTALQMANRRPEGSEQFVVGKHVAITPGKVVFQNELIELIQYAPQTPTVFGEPILIVPSWIMKYYILDLSPGNSLVKYLVGEGHTVFAISWRNPGSADFNVGLEDYLKLGPIAALTEIRRLLPKAQVHALGYCLGGTLLAIAAAFLFGREQKSPLKRAIKSVTLLAAELDFAAPGELSLFIDESQIAYIEDIMREQGYLDGKQMAGAFTLLNSKDLVWSKMIRSYLMGERQPMSDLMAWNSDATRLPYRMHSENLRRLYLRNELASGTFQVESKPVALTDIRVPMFVVAAERDHISPWHSVYKTHMHVDTELTFLLTSGGHNVGVVNPPGTAGSSYRVTRRAASGKYVDPDTWLKSTPVQQGSWWPTWATWLRGHANEHAGEHKARRVKATPLPAMGRNGQLLVDAPGSYVFES